MFNWPIEEWLDTLPLDIDKINLDRRKFEKLPNLKRFQNLKYLKCSYNNQLTEIKVKQKR